MPKKALETAGLREGASVFPVAVFPAQRVLGRVGMKNQDKKHCILLALLNLDG
jgi:hypothetical protein